MKKINYLLMTSLTVGFVFSNTLAAETKSYFLQGIADNGKLYRSIVTAYSKDNKKIGSTIIERPNGVFYFKNLKEKPYFVKVEDGENIGLDRKVKSRDDSFSDETYFAKVKGITVQVTPSSTLEFFTDKKVSLDKKNKILLNSIVDILESLGLSSKESFEAIASSLTEQNPITKISIDEDKLQTFLENKNISYAKILDILDEIKDLVNSINPNSKDDIYALQSAVDTAKNVIEYKRLNKNGEVDETSAVLDSIFVDNLKEVIHKKRDIRLKDLSALISTKIFEDNQNIHRLFDSDELKISGDESKNSLKMYKNTNSVKVIDGPKAETVKIYTKCDKDGFLVENVFSNRSLCKINENGVLKEVKLQRKYMRVKESGNPSIDQKFEAIKDYIRNLFTFEITTKPDLQIEPDENRNFILTIVLRKLDKCNGEEKGFLTLSTVVNMSQTGDSYAFSIPKNSKIFITGNTDKTGSFMITRKVNIKERLLCKNETSTIKVGKYLDALLNQYKQYITKDMKEIIYENLTQPGIFETYILLNETTKHGGTGENNKDFIKNGYLFDATKYQLDLNPYNQDFSDKEHSLKITLKLY